MYKHFNSNNFRNDVSTQPWDDIKELYDPNDMWKKWKELFLSVCDKHAPVKTKRTRQVSLDDHSSSTGLFTHYCYANEVGRHTKRSKFWSDDGIQWTP